MNLAFFEKIGLFLALFEHSCTGNTGYKTEPQFFVTNVASTRVLKNSPIFSKNAKFTLTLMSKEKVGSYQLRDAASSKARTGMPTEGFFV